MSGRQALKRQIWPNSLRLLAILALFCIQSGSSVPANRATPFSEPQMILASFPQLDPLTFQEGDVILRQGRSFVSSMIARSFPHGEGMSHCGILVMENGSWNVIHSISGRIDDRDGIRMQSLESFLAEAKPKAAIHIRPCFPINRKSLIHSARTYLARACPFDHDYDLHDTDRLYCSELIRAVYLEAGAPDVFRYIRLAGKDLVDLASFFDNQYWLGYSE